MLDLNLLVEVEQALVMSGLNHRKTLGITPNHSHLRLFELTSSAYFVLVEHYLGYSLALRFSFGSLQTLCAIRVRQGLLLGCSSLWLHRYRLGLKPRRHAFIDR